VRRVTRLHDSIIQPCYFALHVDQATLPEIQATRPLPYGENTRNLRARTCPRNDWAWAGAATPPAHGGARFLSEYAPVTSGRGTHVSGSERTVRARGPGRREGAQDTRVACLLYRLMLMLAVDRPRLAATTRPGGDRSGPVLAASSSRRRSYTVCDRAAPRCLQNIARRATGNESLSAMSCPLASFRGVSGSVETPKDPALARACRHTHQERGMMIP